MQIIFKIDERVYNCKITLCYSAKCPSIFYYLSLFLWTVPTFHGEKGFFSVEVFFPKKKFYRMNRKFKNTLEINGMAKQGLPGQLVLNNLNSIYKPYFHIILTNLIAMYDIWYIPETGEKWRFFLSHFKLLFS